MKLFASLTENSEGLSALAPSSAQLDKKGAAYRGPNEMSQGPAGTSRRVVSLLGSKVARSLAINPERRRAMLAEYSRRYRVRNRTGINAKRRTPEAREKRNRQQRAWRAQNRHSYGSEEL